MAWFTFIINHYRVDPGKCSLSLKRFPWNLCSYYKQWLLLRKCLEFLTPLSATKENREFFVYYYCLIILYVWNRFIADNLHKIKCTDFKFEGTCKHHLNKNMKLHYPLHYSRWSPHALSQSRLSLVTTDLLSSTIGHRQITTSLF